VVKVGLGILGGVNVMDYNINKDIPNSIFRTYDIRGIVGKELSSNAVYSIGLAIGSEAKDRGQKKIAIGRDGRLSGQELLKALAAGIIKSGCDVINIDEVTTPILYYATNVLDTRSGVMITGSHNPPEYNGIKIVIDGVTLYESAIQDLYQRIISSNFHYGEGKEEHLNLIDQYIKRVVDGVKLAKPLKIVIDCGNGIGGKVAPKLFRGLGCEVVELFCEVDGNFPNHHPDPSVMENMQDLISTVQAQNADIGFAFDGDADRIGVVTNKGDVVLPDRQMMLFVREILKCYPGVSIPFDVKCSRHLANEIIKCGGKPVMIRTGHSILKAKINELKAPIGGELSGHIFFKERWYGFDDGIYAAARMLEIIAKRDCSSADIFADIPNSINTPELKLTIADDRKFKFMEEFIDRARFADANITTIDGIRVDFKDGFGLMRCSNTSPAITFRFEGDNQAALMRIEKEFRDQILVLNKELKLPF
jgi:phosphomannomutase / phosphoglucomutase